MSLQMGKNQPRRMAERASRQPPDPVSYWLIAEKRNNRLEALTIRTDAEQETLPVFSSEEEAEIFLRFGVMTGGWRARESSAGELVSALSGPCAGVEKVALDPSPEMVVEGTVGLVALLREDFVYLVMDRRSGRLRLGEPEELGSRDRSPAIGGRTLREGQQGAPDRRSCDGCGQVDLNLCTKELAKTDTSFKKSRGLLPVRERETRA